MMDKIKRGALSLMHSCTLEVSYVTASSVTPKKKLSGST